MHTFLPFFGIIRATGDDCTLLLDLDPARSEAEAVRFLQQAAAAVARLQNLRTEIAQTLAAECSGSLNEAALYVPYLAFYEDGAGGAACDFTVADDAEALGGQTAEFALEEHGAVFCSWAE